MILTRDLVLLLGVSLVLLLAVAMIIIAMTEKNANKPAPTFEITYTNQERSYQAVLPNREINRESNIANLRAQLETY